MTKDELMQQVRGLLSDDDIDADDVECLEAALTRHLTATRIYRPVVPGKIAAAAVLGCPFYASRSLAQHASLLPALQEQGVRILSAALTTHSGRLLLCLPEDVRDALGSIETDADVLWARWARRLELEGAVPANSRPDLADLKELVATDDEVTRSWIEALQPALAFSLRALPARRQNAVVSKINAWMSGFAGPAIAGAAERVFNAGTARMDPELVTAAKSSNYPKLGIYNYLAAPPPAGMDPAVSRRYRLQAMTALKNFAPVLGAYHLCDPQAQRLRDAIDRGDKVMDILGEVLQTSATTIKQLNRAEIGQGCGATMDLRWIRDFCRALDAVPAQRRPKSSEEVRCLMGLQVALGDLDRIAELEGVPQTELWEGVLKRGWVAAVEQLSSYRPGDPDGSLDDHINRAADAIREVADMLSAVQDTIQHFTAHSPLHPDHALAALLGRRNLFRLADALRDWRGTAAAVAALDRPKSDSLPDGVEWSPMLRCRTVNVGGVVIRELVNEAELQAEGATMDHCVYSYGNRCRTQGFRVFQLVPQEQRSCERSRRATLALILDTNGTFREEQIQTYHNRGTPHRDTLAARDEFIRMLRQGEMECDLNGLLRDRRRLQGEASRQGYKEYLAARSRMVSRWAQILMPKSCRGQDLEQFLASEWVKEQVDLIERNAGDRRPVLPGAFSPSMEPS